MKNIKRLLQYMGDRKIKYFVLLIATLIISAVTQLYYSYIYKSLFNSIEYKDKNLFVVACIMCAIFIVISYVSPYMRYFQMKQVRMIVFRIKIEMFKKLTKLNMQYFEEHHSGDTLKRLNNDANTLKYTYFSGIFRVLVLITNGSASIVAMFIYCSKLALVSIVFSAISVTISISMNKTIENLSQDIQKKVVKLTERLSDLFSGFLVMKMYSGSKLVTERYLTENENITEGVRKKTRTLSLLEMLSFLTGMFGNFGTILIGAFLVKRGEIDYGTIMAVVTLQMSVSGMLQFLGGALADMTSLLVDAQRVFDFLESNEDEVDTFSGISNDKDLDLAYEKGISIEKLTFAYKDREPILHDFNLQIKNGEKVMLVGESGCGKSTILKVLMRFYDQSEGIIRICGHNIEEYSLKQLRNMITYVPQENYLFEGTVMENILFGNPYVDEAMAKDAAQMAYAHDFISDMPDGYDTILSTGGRNLSGGQRQRIAIARAFLKNSPILLMDEPSSALDVESENKINLAMKQLMGNRIVIMVTHRTSSFHEFDRVFEL